MPKVKMSEAEEQRCFLGRVIKSNMERNNITCEKLLKTAGISRSTHFKRIRDPDSMTLGELKIYIMKSRKCAYIRNCKIRCAKYLSEW